MDTAAIDASLKFNGCAGTCMHMMRHDMRDNIMLCGILVAIAAMCLSMALMASWHNEDMTTREQSRTISYLMLILSLFIIPVIYVGVPTKCWWGGFAHAGVSAVTSVAVYGAYVIG